MSKRIVMARKRLFVVYQMGKVASVSIAETLATVDGAEVEHCHYLSRGRIEGNLTKALNAGISPETYWQTSRGLLKNLDVHRRIRRIQAGGEADIELFLISVAREPLAWARSVLVQNLVEHEPDLRRICAAHGVVIDGHGEWLEWAITRIVDNVGRLCEAAGTIVEAAGLDKACIRDALACDHDEALFTRRMAGIFRRPHVWFSEEFLPFTGLALEALDEIAPQVRFGRLASGSVYVIRYEDLPECFDTMTRHMGLEGVRLTRFSNVSHDKRGAEVASRAFAQTPHRGVLEAASVTAYTRFFGYAAQAHGAAAGIGERRQA